MQTDEDSSLDLFNLAIEKQEDTGHILQGAEAGVKASTETIPDLGIVSLIQSKMKDGIQKKYEDSLAGKNIKDLLKGGLTSLVMSRKTLSLQKPVWADDDEKPKAES